MKEIFDKLVKIAKEQIESFNDFSDDRAIVWADNEIKRLQSEISALKLQLSGRTYCRSDEAVEARCKELEIRCTNFQIGLQAIASDAETQTSGNFGMKRLSGYARDTLSGVEWLDEFAKDEPPTRRS